MRAAKQVRARPASQKVRRERDEKYLSVIVEASDDAIIGLDINGTVISWNKGAEKTLGYRSDEILGRPVSVLIPPSRLTSELMMVSQEPDDWRVANVHVAGGIWKGVFRWQFL